MKEKIREQEELAAVLYSNLHKVSQNLRHIELPHGFTPERMRTLRTIQSNGPISVTGLAEMEQVRPATVSRMIASLESDGLIKRKEARDDKRSVLVSTTPRGRQICIRANQRYLAYLQRAIDQLEPDQVQLMHDLAILLEKLSSAMQR
jgi:DNA-binding MarR family transcriptional regulator